MYGTVNERQVQSRKYQAVTRITLNLADAQTGQDLWGSGEIVEKERPF